VEERCGRERLGGKGRFSDFTVLLIILALGAILRFSLLWQLGARAPFIEDAKDYERLAIGILDTGSYVDEGGNLTSLRPPLFPAVVAGLYRLFGRDNFLAVSAFHALLSLATTVVSYFLGRGVYSSRVGLFAAAAACFYPSLLAYNQLLLSETLFTFFVALGALLSVIVLQECGRGASIALGLCLGLGALTRSVLWLFSPLLCLALALLGPRPRRARLSSSGLALASFALCIAPWVYRNTSVQKTLTFIDVMAGRNVMMGNYEYTPLDRSWATMEVATGERSWHRVLAAHTPNYSELTQGQIDKTSMRYGVNFFLSHPWLSLQRSIVKFFNFWQLERETLAGIRQGDYGEVSTGAWIVVALLICGSYATAVFSAIFGALVAPPENRLVHIMLMGWIAFPWMLHTLSFAHSRYHLPFIPIVIVYSAAAVVHRSTIFQRRRTLSFACAALACVILFASWIREFIMVDVRWFT
jgi:4-amino-4-deoxy-L-arabinose transferase-like glycosyltransferase